MAHASLRWSDAQAALGSVKQPAHIRAASWEVRPCWVEGQTKIGKRQCENNYQVPRQAGKRSLQRFLSLAKVRDLALVALKVLFGVSESVLVPFDRFSWISWSVFVKLMVKPGSTLNCAPPPQFCFANEYNHMYFHTASKRVYPCPQLREYPVMFGLKLVELYEWLVGSCRGQPSLPPTIPTALETFQSMDIGDDEESLWSEASIVEVCKYLRGGTSLLIPPDFRPFLPRRL